MCQVWSASSLCGLWNELKEMVVSLENDQAVDDDHNT